MTITAQQIRAARALLGWSQSELADRAHIVRRTLTNIETGLRPGATETLHDLRQVLETAGVIFLNGDDMLGVAVHPTEGPSGGFTAHHLVHDVDPLL